MANHSSDGSRSEPSKRHRDPRPTLRVLPDAVREGANFDLYGSDWSDCPVEIKVGRTRLSPQRITRGYPVPGGIRPDPTGAFIVTLSSADLGEGDRWISVTSKRRDRKEAARAALKVLRQPRPEESGTEDVHKAFWRDRDFFARRFGHLGYVPPGTRITQVKEVRRLRARRNSLGAARSHGTHEDEREFEDRPQMPVPGVCNWTPVGAGPVVTASVQAWAGRTLSIAIDPTDTDIVYAGTANGGIWKSMDGGDTWSPKSDYQMSLAIGALAIDPNDPSRIFAGTGEYNNVGVGTYYGNGLLRSTTGGDAWDELATTQFERDEISRIVFNPSDSSGQTLFLSSSIGVFETTMGGDGTWTELRAGAASDLVVFAPGGPPGKITLIAAFQGSGLWSSTRTGGSWSSWTQFTDSAFPTSFGRIALTQSKTQPKRIMALFAGTFPDLVGLVKTTNGGNAWSKVDVRLNRQVLGSTETADGHTHGYTVPAADMTAATAAHSYTTTSAGAPAHTHTISLTADQFEWLQQGSVVITNTDPDATGHQHVVIFATAGQSWYNLHVAVHPSDFDTIFIGEVNLWRNTSGGGVFDRLTGLHVDHHAFAFDPVTPTTVWACSDGGVWKSANNGTTWQDRNRDLATLQYISVASHPQWESVLIGGTQDNGIHRYSGTPAWQLSAGGDGGFTAIDQSTPTRMYKESISTSFSRSDNAGAPGSWALKNTGITGGAMFYAPFTLDPSNANVCYFGGAELWRSANNADSWTAVTSGVNGLVTAIAVHPGDSNTIYIGTNSGNVYRVQRTGAAWTLADVTLTDLTGPSLPPGVQMSDLAVDTMGTVWVTVAAVLWTEATGEFTNDHVYRRTMSDTTWVTRSSGLAQANPINTLVIDPANNDRLFCGGDLGVWRTDDAGATDWIPWDEGLPNTPVYHLDFHGLRRLLRAATHGRSIWERPVDAASCPMVDLYMRDNVLDSGRVQPSPSGQPHPFDPSKNVYWWQSADVKVDALEPTYQTADAIDNYVDFEHRIVHRTARRERVNRFYVQVHNRGVSKASNVKVRAFFADASAGLPNLPADFWSSGKPFAGTPGATDWTPIGATVTIPVLEAGEPGVVEWDWTIPATAAKHSCLLAVTTCDEDPISASGIFDLATLVPLKKHATLKNLNVENAVPGSAQPDGAFMLKLHNVYEEGARSEVVIDWGDLPDRTRIFIAFEKLPGVKVFDPHNQDKEHVRPVKPKKPVFPKRMPGRCGDTHKLDLDQMVELRLPKSRYIVLRNIGIPKGQPVIMAINLLLPKIDEDVQFDVMQRLGGRTIGGSTYLLRSPDSKYTKGEK